jgi:hypothetical protein
MFLIPAVAILSAVFALLSWWSMPGPSVGVAVSILLVFFAIAVSETP